MHLQCLQCKVRCTGFFPGTTQDFIEAVEGKNTAHISYYLQSAKSGYLDLSNCKQQTVDALVHLSLIGNTTLVNLILNMPGMVDVNTPNSDGETALYVAVQFHQIEVIKTLLAVPTIDVNGKSKNSATPLLAAAHVGNTEIIKLLLSTPNINLNATMKDGSTAVALAAKKYLQNIVTLLVAAGADSTVSTFNSRGCSKSIKEGLRIHSEIVAALATGDTQTLANYAKEGFSLHIKDAQGNGPLHIALDSSQMNEDQRTELVEFLYKYNLNLITAKNKSGKTALDSVRLKGGYNYSRLRDEIIKLLSQEDTLR